MNWNELTSLEQLDAIVNESMQQPVVIFKHSTRCSISSMALDRLERSWDNGEDLKPYYLDLIQYRDVSNQIVDKFGVMHQSPQVIILKDGQVIYDNSHMGISYQSILNAVKEKV
jgi:bacillithiol system protein YtxJ